MSLKFEKLGVIESRGWKTPAPQKSNIVNTSTKSNVLSVHTVDVSISAGASPQSCVVVTTADRRLSLLDPTTDPPSEIRTYEGFQDSPILDVIAIGTTHLIAATMSGRMVLFNTSTGVVVGERKDHAKYLVKLATWSDHNFVYVATAGWDSKVFLYLLNTSADGDIRLENPIAQMTLPTIPETILFLQSPENQSPLLLVTRRDSTLLYYYTTANSPNFDLAGRQNLSPHSNAWVTFSPSDVQICPTDPTIAAIATSSTPHMKVLIVRLLVPLTPNKEPDTTTVQDEAASDLLSQRSFGAVHQSTPERAALASQDRDEAAIRISFNTMAPQTAYSTPTLRWRPDGTGVYISSDDGIIRGFDTGTGKLMVSLEGHEVGSKIRCLATGPRSGSRYTSSHGTIGEYVVSGGFDQRLILWTI